MRRAKSLIFGTLLFALSAGFIMLLSTCGGGGGGGGGGSSSDELLLELGLDGPGDAGNYFPLTVENLWLFHGTAYSPEGSHDYKNTINITETQVIDGVFSLVVQESNSYGEGPFATYLAKDLNGIANVGTDDLDPFGVQLSHYWEGRFPLVPGESFVQLDRSGVNLGEDLDGDSINETVNIRSIVTVVGFTSAETPAGNFDDSIHIARDITLGIIMSSNQSLIPATAREDTLFASGIGWVDRTISISILGENSGAHEVLIAYTVDSQSGGVVQASESVVDGQGNPTGTDSYYAFGVTPGEDLTIALTGLTDNTDLLPIFPNTCNQAHNLLSDTSPEDCQLTTTGNQLIVAVNGLASSHYTLSVAPTPLFPSPISEGTRQNPVPITPNVPTAGQVETRGTSFYSSTGLIQGAHTVSITGLSADADLNVYSDDTYSFELDCTLRASGDVVNYPEDCTVQGTTALYFSVQSGELNREGAWFNILAH